MSRACPRRLGVRCWQQCGSALLWKRLEEFQRSLLGWRRERGWEGGKGVVMCFGAPLALICSLIFVQICVSDAGLLFEALLSRGTLFSCLLFGQTTAFASSLALALPSLLGAFHWVLESVFLG